MPSSRGEVAWYWQRECAGRNDGSLEIFSLPHPWLGALRGDAKPGEHFRRRTFELNQGHGPNVAHVLHSFRRGVESAGRQVAEFRKESGAFLQFGLCVRCMANVVSDRRHLVTVKRDEVLAETALRLLVDPSQAGEHDLAIALLA